MRAQRVTANSVIAHQITARAITQGAQKSPAVWILETATWNDRGRWYDLRTWRDS